MSSSISGVNFCVSDSRHFFNSPDACVRIFKSVWSVVSVSFCFVVLAGESFQQLFGVVLFFSSQAFQRHSSWCRSSRLSQRCCLSDVCCWWWMARLWCVAGTLPSLPSFCAVAPLTLLPSLPEATFLRGLCCLAFKPFCSVELGLRNWASVCDTWTLGAQLSLFGGDFVWASTASPPCLCSPCILASLHAHWYAGAKKCFWKLVFLPTLMNNLKFVVFCAPNCDKWLGSCEDICHLVDFVVFGAGCVERFGSRQPPWSSKLESSCRGGYIP